MEEEICKNKIRNRRGKVVYKSRRKRVKERTNNNIFTPIRVFDIYIYIERERERTYIYIYI
jgi:ribosomal protein S28E/S33